MSRSSTSAGFTLIEVLIALASVSVLLVGAVGLLSTASLAIRSARTSTTATLLAVQKVEQLTAQTTFESGTSEDYFAADGTATPAASAFFIRRWTITSGWVSTDSLSLIVEVFASGAGRVAEVQAVAGGAGGWT